MYLELLINEKLYAEIKNMWWRMACATNDAFPIWLSTDNQSWNVIQQAIEKLLEAGEDYYTLPQTEEYNKSKAIFYDGQFTKGGSRCKYRIRERPGYDELEYVFEFAGRRGSLHGGGIVYTSLLVRLAEEGRVKEYHSSVPSLEWHERRHKVKAEGEVVPKPWQPTGKESKKWNDLPWVTYDSRQDWQEYLDRIEKLPDDDNDN